MLGQNHQDVDASTDCKVAYDEAIQLFLQDCKTRNLSKESIRRYRNGLKKFQQHLDLLQLDFRELTTPLFSHRIIPSMLDEGLALRTVNCNLCVLKEFYKYLAEEGWLESNIATGVKVFKVQPSLAHTFTDGHLQRLLSQPDRSTFTGYRNYVMMMVLLETGIRLKELANLHTTDVSLEEGILSIRQGKGRKARIVPIQRITASELKKYIQERGSLEINQLWITLDNQPFIEAGIRVMISRYCTAADIQGVQCSCHTFRHTMAKKYLLNGGDIFTLKSILGHERMETTEMYVELFSQDLQAQHEKYSPVEHFFEEFPSTDSEIEVLR